MTSNTTRPRDPQLGLTLALLAIQTENPELAALAPVEWTVSQLGTLYGAIDTIDAETVMAAYQAVLGGEPEAPISFSWGGREQKFRILAVMWRDVRVQIRVSSPAQASAMPLAVAA